MAIHETDNPAIPPSVLQEGVAAKEEAAAKLFAQANGNSQQQEIADIAGAASMSRSWDFSG